nr:MAG TPA: hypothetical protein [Bacteriophage sp.]
MRTLPTKIKSPVCLPTFLFACSVLLRIIKKVENSIQEFA